jgi:hypothetical protein
MVFEWFKQFKNKYEDLQDDPRGQHPSTSRNADAVTDIFEMFT